jgi:hypothetical protein
MSPQLNFAAKLFNRIVDFVLRTRSISGVLLKTGATIVLTSLASGWALGMVYSDAEHHIGLSLQTTDGIPGWAVLGVLAVGLTVLFSGVVIGIWDWSRERTAENKRKAIVVELRGLHSSPDTPAKNANFGIPKGSRDWQVVDFRPHSEGQLVDPDLALEKISAVKRSVEAACGGRAKEDVTVALGGLAAVPCLFLAGMLFDDETNILVYDWDRNQKVWRLTDDLDDGKRMLPLSSLSLPSGTKEVLLAASTSYAVDEQAISRTFDLDMPIVHLRSKEMLADRFWSAEKQQAFVLAFRDAVQQLMGQGIERIHLVLAAPASLCIRMGMAYDRRLMPDLVVYQYERTAPVPYPWGYLMPTHGRRTATVLWATKKLGFKTPPS